jgi:hypothetical protein
LSAPQHAPTTPDPAADDGRFQSLSWTSFGISLAVVLAIFVALNPIWKPIDMATMDQNILWSYAPIPLLVLIFLAIERKLRVGNFLIETMRLTMVKFAITYLFAHILWALTEAPPPSAPPADPAATAVAAAPRTPREPPADSAIDPTLTGGVAGLVVDADGAPVRDALVWVSDGLQQHSFASPIDTIRISNDGRGFSPQLSVIRVFQPVTLRSADGALHTVSGTDDTGRRVFNIPVSLTADRALMLERAHGLLTLACEVHRDTEPVAHALVLDHPFVARTTEADGFALTGIPAGEIELTAWLPGGSTATGRLLVRAGQTVSLSLQGP